MLILNGNFDGKPAVTSFRLQNKKGRWDGGEGVIRHGLIKIGGVVPDDSLYEGEASRFWKIVHGEGYVFVLVEKLSNAIYMDNNL